jgi:NADH-quinone oxidoreductase subunit I
MTAEPNSKVIVVDRGAPKLRGGQGLLAGLGVVIKHFGKAFTHKNESPAESTGVFTVQYPEERLKLPEAYRNFPILLYDDESGQELCTSCFQCQRVCPPQVIHMRQASDPVTGKPVPAVDEFVIEYDACMSCGLCAEVCPFDAIKMDHEFEFANAEHNTMTVDKAALDKPISYYENLAPGMWAEVRDTALKKLQGNMKRRSGTIGIAPQMVGKVPESPAAPTPAAAAPAAKTTLSPEEKQAKLEAIRAAKAAQASGETPAASGELSPADEKKARLEAIRAAKAKEKAESGQAEVSTAPAVGDNMPDEKKARLEAIRAAKAKEKAESGQAEVPTAPAVGDNMPDEKKARLEAIRAAKAKQKAEENAASTPPPSHDDSGES